MPNKQIQSLTVEGVTYDIVDNTSGYIKTFTETDPTVPSWAKASSKPSYGLTEISGTDDLRAIEGLTGTSGLLKKTAANTWTLDTNTYLTSYTETDPTVPSWAKASTKPTYTAAEVGALPDSTVIPSKTSDLTNDGDGSSLYVTSITVDEIIANLHPCATDATSQAVLANLGSGTPQIRVPSDYSSLFALQFGAVEPRIWFAWMSGAELELARMAISVNTATGAITLYMRGRTSIASGIMGVDDSWTITDILPIYDGTVV